MMSYEYIDVVTGHHYYVEGKRVYRLTARGNLVYDHDVQPAQPAGAPWWQRLLLALRQLAGV